MAVEESLRRHTRPRGLKKSIASSVIKRKYSRGKGEVCFALIKKVKEEHDQLGHGGRFGAGLPSVGDGSFLFLMHQTE